jgi:hypothetical protein
MEREAVVVVIIAAGLWLLWWALGKLQDMED